MSLALGTRQPRQLVSVKFVASVKNQPCLKVKSRYFSHNKSTNLFPFYIDRVIRQTYTHTIGMHIYIHKYRDIHTFMHMCMNSNIQTKHPHYPIDHRQWENDINR